MPLGKPRNADRDYAILLDARAGIPLEAIAIKHALKAERVQAILMVEQHKVAVSADPRYRELRRQYGVAT